MITPIPVAESKFSMVLQLLLSDFKAVSLSLSIPERRQGAILVKKNMNRVPTLQLEF